MSDLGQPDIPRPLSRRTFLQLHSAMLAAVTFGTPSRRAAADPGSARAGTLLDAAGRTSDGSGTGDGSGADLALNRPVQVSSTDYAATPAQFAVDGVFSAGSPDGTGWRAAPGDPQWICVDLQAVCRVERIALVFEATRDTPPFVPTGGDPRAATTGDEILSSCPVAYTVAVSADGASWSDVYSTNDGAGGTVQIALPQPVMARWARLTVTQRSNANPLGLGEFQVFGTSPPDRPAVTGWTMPHHKRTAAPPELSVAADGTVPVETGWELAMDDWVGTVDPAVLSRTGVDTRRWFDATVPGTVLATLVADGALPDPVAGMNNLSVPEALCRRTWWYRRELHVPAALTARGSRVWLEFDGVNHEAQVWCNGGLAGTVTYPFARAAFEVTDALRAAAGHAVLAVRVAPMPHPGTPGDKRDGVSFVNSYMLELDAPTYACASGWDWMPAVRDRGTGIWNHVRLRATGDVVIGDAQVGTVLPDLPDTGTAEVSLMVPVRNVAASARTVTVRAAFGPVTVADTVSVPAHTSVEVNFSPQRYPALRLTGPKLWWPNGYGPANLYDLTLTATVSGRQSDGRVVRFGIRQLDYRYQRPSIVSGQQQDLTFEATQARYLRLVGYTRATQYGISLYGLSVYGPQALGTDLALHKAATASSVDEADHGPANAVDGDPTTRWSSAFQDNQWLEVDLGASYPVDKVSLWWETAYAKDFAVQVSVDGAAWTDAVTGTNNPASQLQISVNGVRVMCRGGNWGYDELLRRVLDGRLETALRLHADQNFTMIRNWLGTSNREEFYALCDRYGLLVWNDFWWAGDHPPSDPQAYVDIATDTIRRYRTHPCIAVWCGSNEHYPAADIDEAVRQAVATEDPSRLYQNNSAADIVGGHGPYSWVEPASYYSTSDFGFHTEIGIPTVSTAETMARLASDLPAWPVGDVWDYHDWCAHGGQAVDSYRQAIEARLGAAADLEDFCRKAQFVNYESMRAIFEAWNHHLWNDASGVLLWMSHPAWYSTVWQTYDYDFDVNGSYYGARKGCEPVHVQAAAGTWQVDAVNHTPGALPGVVASAQVLDVNGVAQGTIQSATLTVPASSSAPAFTLRWPWNAVTFPAAPARYVRMAGATRTTSYGFSLYTLSVYGPQAPDTDLALHGSATASSVDDPGRGSANAVDGDATTRWSSAYEDNQWIEVDLGAVHDVDRVELVWETAMAKTFAIQTSVDGSTWSTAREITVGGLQLVKLRLHDAGGALLSDNLYWNYGTAQNMQALNTLTPVTLASTVTDRRRDGDRTTLTVRLHNEGASVAAMVVLSLRNASTGDRVLPALYGDTYLWLLPDETRDVTVECATADLNRAAPTVRVWAYNSAPHTVTG